MMARGRIFQRTLARFRVDRAGASAVEFALLAIPFLAVLFAIIEMGLVFVLSVSLANATGNEARQIRVGSLEAAGISATTSSGDQFDVPAFKTAVCSQVQLVPASTCMSQLQVDVRTLDSFGAAAPASPISGSTFNTSNLCFYSGVAGSIVEVRTYYLWPLLDPILLAPLVNLTQVTGANGSTSGKWMLITSTEVMKTEAVPGESNAAVSC